MAIDFNKSLFASEDCLLFGGKPAYEFSPNINFPLVAGFIKMYSSRTRLIISARSLFIEAIQSVICLSEVFESIINAVAIEVVNLGFWPFLVSQKPCQPVGVVRRIINPNTDVAIEHFKASRGADYALVG